MTSLRLFLKCVFILPAIGFAGLFFISSAVCAPLAVTDLTATCISDAAIGVNWSSPGDAVLNNSTFYIEYTSVAADAQNPIFWSTTAAQVSISTSGAAPGTAQYDVVGGLMPNTSYFFRLWTQDDADNFSPLSNGATAITMVEAPTGVYFDEITSTGIVASAYTPAPMFSSLEKGLSGANVSINGLYSQPWRNGNKWVTKAAMPTQRGAVGAAVSGGRVYAVGGIGGGGNLAVNEMYDPLADNWSARAAMFTARNGPGVAAAGGKIYAIGGNAGAAYLSQNEEYNPATNSWVSKTAMPTARWAFGAVAINGNIYAAGGFNGAAYQTKNEEYNPDSNTWATKTALSIGRYAVSAAAVDGKAYVIGGSAGPMLSMNQAYNPEPNSWAGKASLPTARHRLAAAAVGGKIYVIGGTTATVPMDQVDVYDPVSNTWAISAPLPTARYDLAAAAAGGRIYAIGGQNPGYLGVNEEYDPGVAVSFLNLAPNTQYFFKAKARNMAGIESEESATVSTFTHAAVPAAAVQPFAEVSSYSFTTNWLNNGNPGNTLYIAQISADSLFGSIAASSVTYNLSASFSGLSYGAFYYARVAAINTNGIMTYYNVLGSTLTLIPDTQPPSAVTDLTGAALSPSVIGLGWLSPGDNGSSGVLNDSTFTIQYTSVSADAGTQVFWSTTAAQVNLSTSGVNAGSARAYSVTGLLPNTSYYFRLWTKDDAGNFSPLSNGATAATLIEPPVGIYFDEISSTAIVVSAYAPTPAFSNLQFGLSGTNVAIDNGIWVWAGWHNEKWTLKAPLPTSRYWLAAAVAGGKIYAVGGDNANIALDVNEEYNPVEDSWVVRAGMPTGRYALSAASTGGKVYAAGGNLQGSVNEMYDPITNIWTIKGGKSSVEKSAAAAAGNRVFAIGGYAASSYQNINEEYDLVADTWISRQEIPTARDGLTAAFAGGKIYAIGGENAGGVMDVNEEYDPATNVWRARQGMPTARKYSAAAAVGGKIYVFGGEPTDTIPWSKANEEYDPVSNLWASRSVMRVGRSRLTAVGVGGRIYVIGGIQGLFSETATNDEFDPGVAAKFDSLTPNTRYTFKAKARNQEGVETAESIEVSTYTSAVPPAAVTAAALSSTSISVAWSRGADPVNTNFEVQYSSVDAFVSAYAVNTAPLTTNELGSFGGLLPLTTYYFRVRAVNGAGIPTGFIAADPVSTLPVPPVRPAAPSVSAVGVSSITWSWAALSGVSGYRIYPATAPASVIASTGDAAYTRSGLSPNATYSIMVAGVNASGEGPASPAALTVFTLANPPAGTAVGAVYVTSAAITWGLNGNPSGTLAEVYRSTDNSQYSGVLSSQALSFLDAGLNACSTYYYQVRNLNDDGVRTGFSPAVQLFTGDFIPPPPSALAAEPVAGGKLALTWEFSPGGEAAAEYRLYSDNGTGAINYAAPYAVFSSTVSAWLTGALTPGSLYKFGLRAVNRCGVEEENTSVFASATAAASLSGARAVIKVPQTGKRIRGNRVTVAAELTLGTPAQTRQVRFQYRPLGGGAWTDIAAADGNHPNPDLEAPYFVHWDVDSLGIVSAATYELRAQAADLAGTDDQEPPTITVVLDPLDYDIRETLAAGEITKEQKISNTVTTTVQAADDGTALVAKVTIPAGAVDASTVTVSVVNNPSLKPAALSGSDDLNLAVQIGLSNAQSRLSGGNLSTVVLSYNDADGDGVVDGSSVRADQLKMYSAHALADAWEPLPSVFDKVKKTVSGTTSHFSFFALFVPLAADLDAVRVYPVPFVPDDGKADNGAPYSASDPDSGIVFDGLTAAVKIRIYTLSGQLVADFGSASSSGKLQWDGRNEDGKNAASGGYLAVISSPGHKAVVKKLLIIR